MNFEEVYYDTISSVSAVARVGDINRLKAFLNEGKASNIQDNKGWRALHHAAFNGHLECVKLLLKAPDLDINAASFDRQTALYVACCSSQSTRFDIAKALLEAGADPNVENRKQYITILNKAVMCCCPSLVKLLIDYKVDVNEVDDRHGSTLNLVAEIGSLETLQLILNQKLSFNPRARDSCIFFHRLMRRYNKDIGHIFLSYLLKKADCLVLINHQDSRGRTALLAACMHGCGKAVKQLLDYGADPNIRDKRGNLSVCVAAKNLDDNDVQGEDSVFMKLLKLTCKREWKKIVFCKYSSFLHSSLLHLAVLRINKSPLLSLILKEEEKPNSRVVPVGGCRPSLDHYTKWFIMNDNKFYITPFSTWCALKSYGDKSMDQFHMLSKDAELNDTADCKLPPLVMTAFSVGSDSKKADSLDMQIVYELLKMGANPLIKIRADPYHPIPAVFFFAIALSATSYLEFLFIHAVPASVVFTKSAFKEIKSYYARSMSRERCIGSKVLRWVLVVIEYIPIIPSLNALINLLKKREYKEKQKWALHENFQGSSNRDDEAVRTFKFNNELFEAMLTELREKLGSPKSLKHLSLLGIRLNLYNENKKEMLSKSVETFCDEVKVAPAIKKLLMFDSYTMHL